MNEVFICDAIRTPIGRYAGGLSSVRPDDLAAIVLKELLNRTPTLNPDGVDEVVLGCANQAGEDNRNIARMSSLLAGIAHKVPAITINRLCASGMDAINIASNSIKAGNANVLIAGGVESMSRAPLVLAKSSTAFARTQEIYDTTLGWRFINKQFDVLYGTDSMPETAENVAKRFNISRKDQDIFAHASQQKTARAIQSGRLAKEIFPLTITRKKDTVIIDTDEHPRANTTLEKLASLPTLFREDGSVTAGNASGVNDGAAVLLLASHLGIDTYNLTPRAKIISYASVGVEPSIMGIGPGPAAIEALKKANLSFDDLSVIELNEAFASQVLASIRHWGLADDDTRINQNGGAIALGHPLGMSGARLVLTATEQLHQVNGTYALCTMCVGVGQGVAMVIQKI